MIYQKLIRYIDNHMRANTAKGKIKLERKNIGWFMGCIYTLRLSRFLKDFAKSLSKLRRCQKGIIINNNNKLKTVSIPSLNCDYQIKYQQNLWGIPLQNRRRLCNSWSLPLDKSSIGRPSECKSPRRKKKRREVLWVRNGHSSAFPGSERFFKIIIQTAQVPKTDHNQQR